MNTRLYWVLYDYGQGGLWAVVRAASIAQIAYLYPAVQVFESAPASLDAATIDRILQAGVQDAEHPSLDWLGSLLHTNGGAVPP